MEPRAGDRKRRVSCLLVGVLMTLDDKPSLGPFLSWQGHFPRRQGHLQHSWPLTVSTGVFRWPSVQGPDTGTKSHLQGLTPAPESMLQSFDQDPCSHDSEHRGCSQELGKRGLGPEKTVTEETQESKLGLL